MAIIEDGEGNEFVDWPEEGFFGNESDELEKAPTARECQLSDEKAKSLDSTEMARKSEGIRSNEGPKLQGRTTMLYPKNI